MYTALSEVLVFKLFRAGTITRAMATPAIVITLDITKTPSSALFPSGQSVLRGYIPLSANERSFPYRHYHNSNLSRSYFPADCAVSAEPGNLLSATVRVNNDIFQSLLRQLPFEAGNLNRHFLLTFGRGMCIFQLAALGIKL